jgi:hypothetical protein
MRTLASFGNIHQGQTIIVCGCGESLNELTQPERFITIGVNDVGRRFQPNYLVVVNPPNQFTGDRFSYVESSQAEYLFTQLNLGLSRENIVRFQLGAYGGTDFSNPDVLHHTQNSPYVALCLAVHLGAKRIGLIGVDFTENHFFAQTGTHSLTPQFSIIDEQYKRLGEAIKARGAEVFNLSRASRLTAFPKMSIEDFAAAAPAVTPQPIPPIEIEAESHLSKRKIFFINYKFLSCGAVFTDGLRHAAKSLGVPFQEAYWDDARLPAAVQEFKPDLLFVVHGRRFVQRYGNRFPSVKKAVWLLDEPYEVDDTAQWSNTFDVVFVNDPSTLERHRNAHYLPVAYDFEVHRENGDARKYQVGFIGGHNETRERYLLALQQAGYLSYVVGGTWKSPELRRLCLAPNIPASATADFYRQTKIVVNLFRDVHHFNRHGIQPYSMNPRIYEALACGAVVVSEARPELRAVFPELPIFSDASQLLNVVGDLLNNDDAYRTSQRACQERLRAHDYRQRLLRVFETLDWPTGRSSVNKTLAREVPMKKAQPNQQSSSVSLDGWELCGQAAEISDDGNIALRKTDDDGLGTEQGLASTETYQGVELSFEVNIARDACFIAKLRQASQFDQKANSYHLFCHPGHTYLARHNHVFRTVHVKRDQWQRIGLKCDGRKIELEIGGVLAARVVDGTLKGGYCFLGVKSGRAMVRNLRLRCLTGPDHGSAQTQERGINPDISGLPRYEILHAAEREEAPTVSIITTVYDRVDCLAECMRSVRELRYGSFEHIIVSDHPPDEAVDRILALATSDTTGIVTYANLNTRFNNWGIAPASVGCHLARGRYICFLSDDNGYTSDHLDPLVAALDQDRDLGFVYSSCQYAGRLLLRNASPLPGGIDLGQPLFRKEMFDQFLPGTFPFNMMAWDWHMIETFMRKGAKWRHIDQPSFLFRLAACRKWAQV